VPPLRAVIAQAAEREPDRLVARWLAALAEHGEFLEQTRGSGRPSSDIPEIPDHAAKQNTTKHRPRVPESEP
jgi:hypothetical protein